MLMQDKFGAQKKPSGYRLCLVASYLADIIASLKICVTRHIDLLKSLTGICAQVFLYSFADIMCRERNAYE